MIKTDYDYNSKMIKTGLVRQAECNHKDLKPTIITLRQLTIMTDYNYKRLRDYNLRYCRTAPQINWNWYRSFFGII